MISIIGLPTDINSSFISGASKAPTIIKNQFNSNATNKYAENGCDLEKMDKWIELGNLNSKRDWGYAKEYQILSKKN